MTSESIPPQGEAPAAPPELTWRPIARGAIAGWIVAWLALLLGLLVLSFIGADVWDEGNFGAHMPFFWGEAPGALANLALWFVASMAVSISITLFVAGRIERPVSLPLVFASIAIFGAAPFLGDDSLLRLGWLGSLIVAVLVIRFVAVGQGRPSGYVAAMRISVSGFRVLGIAIAAALVYLVAYSVTHPLHLNSASALTITEDSRGRLTTESSVDTTSGEPVRVGLRGSANAFYLKHSVGNGGFFGADLKRVEGIVSDPPGAAVVQSIRSGGIDVGLKQPSTLAAPIDVRLDPHSGYSVDQQVVLRVGVQCGRAPTRSVALKAIQVRYRLLGRDWTTQLPLENEITAVCPVARAPRD